MSFDGFSRSRGDHYPYRHSSHIDLTLFFRNAIVRSFSSSLTHIPSQKNQQLTNASPLFRPHQPQEPSPVYHPSLSNSSQSSTRTAPPIRVTNNVNNNNEEHQSPLLDLENGDNAFNNPQPPPPTYRSLFGSVLDFRRWRPNPRHPQTPSPAPALAHLILSHRDSLDSGFESSYSGSAPYTMTPLEIVDIDMTTTAQHSRSNSRFHSRRLMRLREMMRRSMRFAYGLTMLAVVVVVAYFIIKGNGEKEMEERMGGGLGT